MDERKIHTTLSAITEEDMKVGGAWEAGIGSGYDGDTLYKCMHCQRINKEPRRMGLSPVTLLVCFNVVCETSPSTLPSSSPASAWKNSGREDGEDQGVGREGETAMGVRGVDHGLAAFRTPCARTGTFAQGVLMGNTRSSSIREEWVGSK